MSDSTPENDEVDEKLKLASQLEGRLKSAYEEARARVVHSSTSASSELSDDDEGSGTTNNGSSGSSSESEEDSASALLAAKIRMQSIKADNRKQDIQLRKRLATWSIVFVGGQLVASNYFFWVYLDSNRTDMDAQVMIAWLGASVIEVIGILLVIARSLFPVKRQAGGNDNGSGSGS